MVFFLELIFIDSVDEFDSSQKVRDVVVAAEFSPTFLRTLSQLKHHRQTGFGTAVAFRFAVPQADCGECAFDRIGRVNMTPVLSREIEERQQHVAVFLQTLDALFVLCLEGFFKQVKRLWRSACRSPSWGVSIDCVVRVCFDRRRACDTSCARCTNSRPHRATLRKPAAVTDQQSVHR